MNLGASKTHGKFQTHKYTVKLSTLDLWKTHIPKTNFPKMAFLIITYKLLNVS